MNYYIESIEKIQEEKDLGIVFDDLKAELNVMRLF